MESTKLSVQAPTVASRPLTLRANFQWTFVGNMVNALSQWAVLMVLAKLGDEASVGRFSTGLAVTAPVMAFAMLQLRSVQVTDARGNFPFADYFGTRIAWTVFGGVAILFWAFAAGYDRQTVWVITLVGLAKAIDSLSDIIRGIFQRYERMDFSGISLGVRGLAGLLGFGTVQWITRDVVAASAGMAVAFLASFLFYDVVCATRVLRLASHGDQEPGRFRARFDRKAMLKLTLIALPLGLVMGLIALQVNIPRLVLERYGGLEAIGYFTVMVYPMLAGQMVIGALGQSAAPRLARYYVEDTDAYRRLLGKLLLLAGGIGVALVVGTALLGGPVLALLYRPDYAAYHREFVVLAIAAAVQLISSCWGYALTSARRFRVQVSLVSISCIATTVAAFVLVPKWGVMGAALTVLITSIVSWGVYLLAMRSALRAVTRI